MSKGSSDFSHVPVLFEETLDGLAIRPDGVYVDCTTGGAGHAGGILERLTAGGRLIALDQDQDALAAAAPRLEARCKGGSFELVRSNFAGLSEVLDSLGISSVDGILADLGVSSHQLDKAERGFSYMQDGPLDMRMDQGSGQTAADLIASLDASALAEIFRTYGEERYATKIAQAIVQRRQYKPFNTTADLADVIREAMPAKARREKQHPAKRCFQALRIAVNGELDKLRTLLDSAPALLAPGGRLAIITFHSLEDRIVKQAFRLWSQPCICPSHIPACVCGRKPLGHVPGSRKGVVASKEEAEMNARARSARLRVFERNEETLPADWPWRDVQR